LAITLVRNATKALPTRFSMTSSSELSESPNRIGDITTSNPSSSIIIHFSRAMAHTRWVGGLSKRRCCLINQTEITPPTQKPKGVSDFKLGSISKDKKYASSASIGHLPPPHTVADRAALAVGCLVKAFRMSAHFSQYNSCTERTSEHVWSAPPR